MKKVAIFLIFILMFSFVSCGPLKGKIEEKIEKKVSKEAKKTEGEIEKSAETSSDKKPLDDENSKKDKEDLVDKKDAKFTDEDYYAKTTEVIAATSNPEFSSYIQEMFIEDLDNDGEIETLTIIDYSKEGYKTLFLMEFDEFENPTTINFDLGAYLISPTVNVVDIKGIKNKVLYLYFDAYESNRIELYEITEKGFKTLISSFPEIYEDSSTLGYPAAHVGLLDKNERGIGTFPEQGYENLGLPGEYVHVEYFGEDVLYYYLSLMYGFEAKELSCKSGELSVGPPPETPTFTLMQYLELRFIKSFICEETEQTEIFGLTDRLVEISDIDSELDIWNKDVFLNTPTGWYEGRDLKPKFVFDESVNGSEATVVLSLDCDDDYFTIWDIRGRDFKATYHLKEEDNGIWKIVSSEYEE